MVSVLANCILEVSVRFEQLMCLVAAKLCLVFASLATIKEGPHGGVSVALVNFPREHFVDLTPSYREPAQLIKSNEYEVMLGNTNRVTARYLGREIQCTTCIYEHHRFALTTICSSFLLSSGVRHRRPAVYGRRMDCPTVSTNRGKG